MAGTAEAVLKYFKCFFLSAEPALPSLPSSSLVIACGFVSFSLSSINLPENQLSDHNYRKLHYS